MNGAAETRTSSYARTPFPNGVGVEDETYGTKPRNASTIDGEDLVGCPEALGIVEELSSLLGLVVVVEKVVVIVFDVVVEDAA